ncbi:MAG: hypothetical protein ABIH38_05895 [Patescibacteria group bacterium]
MANEFERGGPPSDEFDENGMRISVESSGADIEVPKKPAYEGPESLENKLRFELLTEPGKDGPIQVERHLNEDGGPVFTHKRCLDEARKFKCGNEIHNQFNEQGELEYQKQEDFNDEAAFKAERKITGGFEKKLRYSDDGNTTIEEGHDLPGTLGEGKAWENTIKRNEAGRKEKITGKSTAGPEKGRVWEETNTYYDNDEIYKPDGVLYTGNITRVENTIIAQGDDKTKTPEGTVILKYLVHDEDGKLVTYWREEAAPKE